jgi:hypothetical protein
MKLETPVTDLKMHIQRLDSRLNTKTLALQTFTQGYRSSRALHTTIKHRLGWL